MSLSDYPSGTLFQSLIEKITILKNANLSNAITAMEMANQYGLPTGFCMVLNDEQRLVGVITDGDIREALLKGYGVNTSIIEIMTKDPIVVPETVSVRKVLTYIQGQILESGRKRTIKQAVLVNETRQVIGVIDVTKLAFSQLSNWSNIAVIGLGYVGLTLAVTLAELGFDVSCWDVDKEVRDNLRKGTSHVYEAGLESLLKDQLDNNRLEIACSYEQLRKCSVFIVAVSTPVKDTQPDISYINDAVVDLTGILKQGDLVVIRSTVPVGTCRDLGAGIIESRTEFVIGKDIGISFAPERTIEGKAMEELRTLPQIIGGINEWSTEATARVFSKLSPTIVRVGGLEEAELIKLLNNSFRDISFAFANEVAMICEAYNIDAAKVIKSANSGYPRNKIALPSPGVGGPCLVKDPYIYSSAFKKNFLPSLAEVSRKINEKIPTRLAQQLVNALVEMGKESFTCNIFVLGLAFKGEPEITDMRNSPALDLIAALQDKVGAIYGYDPIVPINKAKKLGIAWKEINDGFTGADAVLLMNDHRSFIDIPIYRLIEKMNRPGILFDGWSFFDAEGIEQIPGMRYMGLGYLTPWLVEDK